MLKTLLAKLFLVLVAVVAAIQLLPFGREHTNPPVQTEPAWDSPQTRELAVRACFDCHSNATVWPWYSNLAPLSWLIQHDVAEGRSKLNFSTWNVPQREAREAAKTVRSGEMPPMGYTILHPSAALSASEREALAAGLAATIGQRR